MLRITRRNVATLRRSTVPAGGASPAAILMVTALAAAATVPEQGGARGPEAITQPSGPVRTGRVDHTGSVRYGATQASLPQRRARFRPGVYGRESDRDCEQRHRLAEAFLTWPGTEATGSDAT